MLYTMNCIKRFLSHTKRTHYFIFCFAVPPDPPFIVDSSGRRVGSLIGPYDEGESLSINCMSSNGNDFAPFNPVLGLITKYGLESYKQWVIRV